MFLLRLLYLSVCLRDRGNSGTEEKNFTTFGPNISQFKHVIKNQKTKLKTRILKSSPQTFRLTSPAIAAKRLDQRLQPH